MPRIAAIVLAYNRPKLLALALKSIALQTRPADEIVVIDDASQVVLQDATDVPDDLSVHFIRQQSNTGPALAAVRGLHETSGELVAFLNDDDLWNPCFLDRLAGALDCEPEAAVAFCDHHVIRADGTADEQAANEASRRFGRSGLAPGLVTDLPRVALVAQAIPAASFALARRTALDPRVIGVGSHWWDYFVTLSVCRTGQSAIYVPDRLGWYRESPDGLTARGGSPEHRLAHRATMIRGARLALHSPPLRSLRTNRLRLITESALRGVAISILRMNRGTRKRGIAQIAEALFQPIDVDTVSD